MKKLLLLLIILPLVLFSCSSDDEDGNKIKIKNERFVLNFQDEAQIEASSDLKIVYSSESEYVAEVSSSGLITAGRVGETSIILNNGENSKSISVVVEALHNIYPEPIHKVKFNDTKETIKAAFGNNFRETETGILYNDYHKNYDYIFLFENNKMTAAGIFIPTLSLPDDFSDFLSERYQIVSLEGYTAAFINEKRDMAVGASPTDDLSAMLTIYVPFSTSKSASSFTSKDKILKAYLELKKQNSL